MRLLGLTFDYVNVAPMRQVGAATFAILFAAGCAAPKPLSSQEQFAGWLSQSPRTIAISVSPELPAAGLVSRDNRTASRVGLGLLGGVGNALGMFAAGCLEAGLVGCVVGVIYAPVAAVDGAQKAAGSVRPIYQRHSLEATQGASDLVALYKAMDLPAMLAKAVTERPVRAHSLLAVEHYQEGTALVYTEWDLNLGFADFQLVMRSPADDPEVALALKVSSKLRHNAFYEGGWASYAYEGRYRRVSAWRADEGKLFREELQLAVHTLAADIVQDLRSPHQVAAKGR